MAGMARGVVLLVCVAASLLSHGPSRVNAMLTWPGNSTSGGHCLAPIDVVVVAPSSEVLTLAGLDQLRHFIIQLSRTFEMAQQHARFAVVQYADQGYPDAPLTDDRLRFEEHVQRLRWRSQPEDSSNPWCDVQVCPCDLSGFTCDVADRSCCANVNSGLEKAWDLLKQQRELEIEETGSAERVQAIVLIADSIDSRGLDPKLRADEIRNDGVMLVVSIGEGHGTTTQDRNEIATWSSEYEGWYSAPFESMTDNIAAMNRDYLCRCPFDCHGNGVCSPSGQCQCSSGNENAYCSKPSFPWIIVVVSGTVIIGMLGAYALIFLDKSEVAEKRREWIREKRRQTRSRSRQRDRDQSSNHHRHRHHRS